MKALFNMVSSTPNEVKWHEGAQACHAFGQMLGDMAAHSEGLPEAHVVGGQG